MMCMQTKSACLHTHTHTHSQCICSEWSNTANWAAYSADYC